MKSMLFSPYDAGPVRLKNRIVMAPMCQYSSQDGFVAPWHLQHYAARAYGGASLIILEASAVEERGRISPNDLGIWKDAHIPGLQNLAESITAGGAVAGIQLAHAGRKASTSRPFDGFGPLEKNNGGWQVVAPSPIPYSESYPHPAELSIDDIQEIQESFILAARRAIGAGYRVIELHSAHGYLIHSFLSPLSNQRTDEYGGDFDGRTRFLMEIAGELRAVCSDQAALFIRISADDWMDGGWDLGQSIELARRLKNLPVDVIHVSSGGISPSGKPSSSSRHYQVSLSEAIQKESGISCAAVGMITDPRHAEEILTTGKAKLVALGRELLRNPYWPQHAARELGAELPIPIQYARAWR